MLRAISCALLTAASLCLAGCNGSHTYNPHRVSAVVLKITGLPADLADSSGAMTGNPSVRIHQDPVYTIKLANGQVWTISLQDGYVATAAIVAARICKGTVISLPVVDIKPEYVKEESLKPGHFGGVMSADDIIVPNPCLT